MIRPRHLWRLLSIYRVLVRHGLEEIALATHMLGPFRFVGLLSPTTWGREKNKEPLGARIRLALEDLGPIFVKFGQALSTRPDLLSRDIAMELAKLQDRVPPFGASCLVGPAGGRQPDQDRLHALAADNGKVVTSFFRQVS